jgi:hypothetical protein
MGKQHIRWVALALVAALWTPFPSTAATTKPANDARAAKRAAIALERASREVRHVAYWVVDSRDNRNLPFAIIDKRNTRIFVFDRRGRIRGAAPVLLGSAYGDHSVPGIGERALSEIRPHERTTPAGRFLAERGRNDNGEDIIWVDYEAAISIHRVRAGQFRNRRLKNLISDSPADNRISYGCINIAPDFYNNVINPVFSAAKGIVYVLPETRPARELFGSYDVAEEASRRLADALGL